MRATISRRRSPPSITRRSRDRIGRGKDDLIPGTFKLKRNLSNDYLIDRQMQKTQTFTGIDGVNTQDFALQEGMGPIVDSLARSISAPPTARSSPCAACCSRRSTRSPPAARRPAPIRTTHRGVRPHEGIIKNGGDWREAFAVEGAARW